MKTVMTVAMILAVGAAPAFAQSTTTSSAGQVHTDTATAPSDAGGVAGVGSSATAMGKKTVEAPPVAPMDKTVAKTGPATSASPGVDHTEPKGAPSTASHTTPQ